MCIRDRPNSYDHKRHHAAKENGEPITDRTLPVWDFVIVREDGTAIRLHPQWSTTKIEAFPAQGYLEPVQYPAKGKGQSLGPGTYAWFKEAIGTSETLRFDAQFRRPRQPQRGVPLEAEEDRPRGGAVAVRPRRGGVPLVRGLTSLIVPAFARNLAGRLGDAEAAGVSYQWT